LDRQTAGLVPDHSTGSEWSSPRVGRLVRGGAWISTRQGLAEPPEGPRTLTGRYPGAASPRVTARGDDHDPLRFPRPSLSRGPGCGGGSPAVSDDRCHGGKGVPRWRWLGAARALRLDCDARRQSEHSLLAYGARRGHARGCRDLVTRQPGHPWRTSETTTGPCWLCRRPPDWLSTGSTSRYSDQSRAWLLTETSVREHPTGTRLAIAAL
jgi:hypothetical protein